MFCTKCGAANPNDALYCAKCGTRLVGEEGPAEQTSTISLGSLDEHDLDGDPDGDGTGGEHPAEDALGLPTGTAVLLVKRGPNAGSRFHLDKEVTTAGRHPESDIFLDDVTVSRRHAELRQDGADITLHDVGSLNGTYLNRERIDRGVLRSGDEVQIGKFRLVYFSGRPGDSA